MKYGTKIPQFTAAVLIACACLVADLFGATQYRMVGRIESVGKNNAITILFNDNPVEKSYYIIRGEDECGTVEVLSVVYDRDGRYKYRAIARYALKDAEFSMHIRAGADIALVAKSRQPDREYADEPTAPEPGYRKIITTSRDGREMLLVPQGKFMFGSNTGDKDESPEQVVFVDDYYIDRREVSNEDFMKYVRAMNVKTPASWEKGEYPEDGGSLPVLVTFYEAEAYARWAGKRLPTEEEWEKAARGPGRAIEGGKNFIYPWGPAFDPERANCADFWADDKTGAHLKIRYNRAIRGPMAVDSFDPDGASPYGAVNMAGNVREWTSSWYTPYKGGGTGQGRQDKKYGKQYRVVRGGAWYSSRYELRVSNRETGGAPNLHADNTAGFRCVKKVDPVDSE